MCGMEDNSDYVWRNLLIRSVIVSPHYDPQKLKGPMGSATQDLQYIAAGYRYNVLEQCDPDQRLLNNTTSMVELFKRMKKSGIIDAFAKQVAELDKKDSING